MNPLDGAAQGVIKRNVANSNLFFSWNKPKLFEKKKIEIGKLRMNGKFVY